MADAGDGFQEALLGNLFQGNTPRVRLPAKPVFLPMRREARADLPQPLKGHIGGDVFFALRHGVYQPFVHHGNHPPERNIVSIY